VGDENESMRTTAMGRRIMIARDQPGDGLGELRGERRALGRRAKTNLGVDGERREMLALFLGGTEELADLAHDARGQGDQITRRESIGGTIGIAGDLAQRSRRDDVRGGGGDHASLDKSPPSALFDRTNEPVRLECTKVIVHLLARKPHTVCKRRGRARLGELRQEASADRIERHHGGGGIVDDFEVGDRLHGSDWTIDNFCCQARSRGCAPVTDLAACKD